jgi:signal transduction histidine kinase/ActR/RegA family two-component response regulator
MVAGLIEPVLLASSNGHILSANVAGAEALGTSIDALEGATLASFSPAPAILNELLATGDAALRFPLRGRDGRRFWCDTRALDDALILVRITGAAADEGSRAYQAELSTLRGVTAPSLVDRKDVEIARALLAQGMSDAMAIAGGLHLTDRSGRNLELVCSVGYPAEVAERFRLVPLTAPLPLVHALRRGEPVWLGTPDDFATQFPDFAHTHGPFAQRAIACVPLESAGRAIGVLGFGFPMPWTFTEESRRRLTEFARRCAAAFDQVGRNDADDARRAASRLERLQAYTGTLARAMTPAAVAEAVVDAGMATTFARSGSLWLAGDRGEGVVLVRELGPAGLLDEGDPSDERERAVRLLVGGAMRDGTPTWIESAGQLEERLGPIERRGAADGEQSLACLPLFAQGRCIGALVYGYDGVHPFLEDERAFLQVIARHSAQAIERARLYDAEKRARERAEANQRRSELLAQAGTVLASSLDYPATLGAVARAAVPGFADWCILELEEERLRGEPPTAAHVDPAKIPFVLELSRRVREEGERNGADMGIAAVTRTGQSFLYPAVTMAHITGAFPGSPELVELYASTGLASSIVVPIWSRGRTLGALVLNSILPGRHYDEQDLRTAEELGRRIGLAVDNARLYRDMRENDRLKDQFLAMLSHELRNPLAPIVSTLDTLELRGAAAFPHERSVISRHVRHLVRLVDDLLDVSRITRGLVELVRVDLELSEIVAEAVEMAKPLVTERSQRLTISVPERGLRVSADRVRLAQAVANVLINAAKYTEAGGAIAVEGVADAGDAVIRIMDSGIGIAPALLPRIFDLFVQGRSTLDRTQGGLGIGLTVAKSVAELHGGSVSARSAGPGHGSEFVLRVPRSTAGAAVTPIALPATPRRAVNDRLRVLVVDDNQDAASMLGEIVKALGGGVRLAHDGASALEIAATLKPDLVLLDIGLPDIDGYEVAKRLRRAPETAAARLVAITGYGQRSDRLLSFAAGFDEHVVKPVDVGALAAILAQRGPSAG